MMETFSTFVSLYGSNLLWLCGLVIIWGILSLVAGIAISVFEKLEHPWMVFGVFLAIMNLLITVVNFAEAGYGG